MQIRFESWLIFVTLAGLIGLVADRTSICTVKAVMEVLTTRRAYMLLSFAKTVLWVVGVTIALTWLLDAPRPASIAYDIAWPVLLGGVIFGVGAVLNGGCAFSTLIRLGNGNFGMLLTLSGFAMALAFYQLGDFGSAGLDPVRAASSFAMSSDTALVLGAILAVWLIWELIRLWRTAEAARWWTLWSSPRFRLSTAALIIGISNGILYAYLGTWSYTYAIRRGVTQMATPVSIDNSHASTIMLWSLFLAVVAGVVVSAAMGRQFALSWRPQKAWHAYFWGGGLMGLGAAMVPGGNDVLLLNAIPGLSPHALPAYLAMLFGIFVALSVKKRLLGELPTINCSGDQCHEFNNARASETA